MFLPDKLILAGLCSGLLQDEVTLHRTQALFEPRIGLLFSFSLAACFAMASNNFASSLLFYPHKRNPHLKTSRSLLPKPMSSSTSTVQPKAPPPPVTASGPIIRSSYVYLMKFEDTGAYASILFCHSHIFTFLSDLHIVIANHKTPNHSASLYLQFIFHYPQYFYLHLSQSLRHFYPHCISLHTFLLCHLQLSRDFGRSSLAHKVHTTAEYTTFFSIQTFAF